MTHLNSQSDGVEQDENEHHVLKSCGVDDRPELILNRILRDVKFEWLSLQSVLHALALQQTHNRLTVNTLHHTLALQQTHNRLTVNTLHTLTQTQSDLVLVQLTVFVLLFSLLPEGDDDETDENVHHEEGNDDDVDDEEDGDLHPVVIDGTRVLPVSIDSLVQQTGGGGLIGDGQHYDDNNVTFIKLF